MRPFVAPLTRMTHREHDNRLRMANAIAQFAIEIWRTVIVVTYIHPPTIAITIQEYLGASHNARHFIVITDASPWRICAALLNDPLSSELLIWTTYRNPTRDLRTQFQVQRENLDRLLDSKLVAHYNQTTLYPTSG